MRLAGAAPRPLRREGLTNRTRVDGLLAGRGIAGTPGIGIHLVHDRNTRTSNYFRARMWDLLSHMTDPSWRRRKGETLLA